MPDPTIVERARRLAAAAPPLDPNRAQRLALLLNGATRNPAAAADAARTYLGGAA